MWWFNNELIVVAFKVEPDFYSSNYNNCKRFVYK